jgi:hypothetical protein
MPLAVIVASLRARLRSEGGGDEMERDWTCSFCGQGATLAPSAGLRVCNSCAKRIAKLVVESKPERIAEIWSSVAPSLGRVEPQPVARGEIDIERVFDQFKEGVAKQISADDVDSHTHLAEAYREMGMYVDAVREAAIAVTAAVAPRSAEGPLGFLLTPPLLRPDGLGRLRERLNRRAS